ncbi:MAG TPA: SigB/SigF/SigG family RNA polymerase sigma factor, partial [Acidimicrobiales bacterium]|nr:SigB/SigF/SigG family RNA polymerase sigma factor [Acidimicrobiales bacterium]
GHYHRHRDREARDSVVAAYQGLAYSLAARFSQRGEELDDLNQVALIGLLKAIERFDPDRGAELTTFATATILGELKRHLRDRGWSVRLPRRIHDLHLRAQQAIDELTQELGRSPTILELAGRLGEAVEDVVEALDAGGLRHNASLEAPLSPNDDHSLTSRLGSGDQRLAEVDGRLALNPLLERLPARQRQILTLRFVFGCSQTEIATMVGVSQMQVSRLLARSLAQLRTWAEPESA